MQPSASQHDEQPFVEGKAYQRRVKYCEVCHKPETTNHNGGNAGIAHHLLHGGKWIQHIHEPREHPRGSFEVFGEEGIAISACDDGLLSRLFFRHHI